ncbi:comEA protein [Mesocricetibacter intestinalis]|uniref:ComEA protein n=1 Tax=Mesocricetibacter intestinalis TaxID=1521930 RepID=A0A4R6VFK6_9PAST|nr:ComEA family DNA-binding protein [Mesocricetibacter intestinalis]TDQ59642.1 comEA protein [Mesocricetibacter intestinalis]
MLLSTRKLTGLITVFAALLLPVQLSAQSSEQSASKLMSADGMNSAMVEGSQSSAPLADKLNINTASAEEIQQALVGIGAKKAQAIVDYRQQHGAFTAVEQLLEVKGIGNAILEKNKDRLVF